MITYETIRRIEEEERVSRKLSNLPPRFVHEVIDYLEKKEAIAKEKDDKWEHQAARQRFQNIMELRERKIVNFTLSYVRSGAAPEGMTPEEKELFDKIVRSLEEFKGQKEKVISGEKFPMKTVAFLQEIPQFVGIDMGYYGPYKSGDIATVPEDNARLLSDKGAGEIIEAG